MNTLTIKIINFIIDHIISRHDRNLIVHDPFSKFDSFAKSNEDICPAYFQFQEKNPNFPI